MFPRRELTDLARARELLHRRIAARRRRCAAAAVVVARPLALIDRGLALWRRISPLVTLAGLALALLGPRREKPKAGVMRTVVRWLPSVLAALRTRP